MTDHQENATVQHEASLVNLTEKQVEAKYNLTTNWLQRERWKRTGPPYIKLERRVLYPVAELERWLAQHMVRPVD